MRAWMLAGCLMGVWGLTTAPAGAATPAGSVAGSSVALDEIMAIPINQIPESLLRDAHGVAIIPNVIKVGFIGGFRRGHGVLLIRDQNGNWSLPQFVTITGGSIGWQIGAQSSDIILVFRSARSIEGVMNGKFTIGADAAAAAGPVGRNVAAATDAELKAEILSYSRSRGLFAGVSIDGSALEIDRYAAAEYYATNADGTASRVPQAAAELTAKVASIAGGGSIVGVRHEERKARVDPETLRAEVVRSAAAMNALLPAEWQRYLALPAEIHAAGRHPQADALAVTIGRYEQVALQREYASLTTRPEFQATLQLLRIYRDSLAQGKSTLELPPPPGGR